MLDSFLVIVLDLVLFIFNLQPILIYYLELSMETSVQILLPVPIFESPVDESTIVMIRFLVESLPKLG